MLDTGVNMSIRLLLYLIIQNLKFNTQNKNNSLRKKLMEVGDRFNSLVEIGEIKFLIGRM